MNAESIRCASDLSLFKALLENEDVKRVNNMIARHEAEGYQSTRRHLLSTSVRLTESMAPEFHAMANDCIDALGVKLPLELFVYSSAQFNAACFKPEADRLYVMFSSSILEGFTPEELRFVMGHELGHHVYDHHAIPIGYLLRGQQRPDPKLALDLFAWSRYAEISADRAGAHCAQNMDAVAHALFKLSSGLTSANIRFNPEDFVAQVDEMQAVDDEPGRGAPQSDWFSTHPFSPLRVKALKLFERSTLYSSDAAQLSVEQLESDVQKVLSLMEPSYLESKTDIAESLRRLLMAGLVAVADASSGINDREVEVFEKFFGKYSFSDKLNVDKLKATLSRRIAEVKDKASSTQATQVLSDLCLMAHADGRVARAERAVLIQIAEGLGVSSGFIDRILEQDVELD
jgi:hypothetical protein